MNIIVASTNPAKIQAVRQAFARLYPGQPLQIEGVAAASGIANQPLSEAETLQGAKNRCSNAKQTQSDADFYLGLEGGVEDSADGMRSFSWVAVLAKDGRWGQGRAASFFLPPKIAELVRSGMELGQADDVIFKRSGSNTKEGAVGIMTHGLIKRSDAFETAIILAMIPFINPELY